MGDRARCLGRHGRTSKHASLERWDDMIHVWQAFAPLLPEAAAALERIGAFVRARVPARRRRPLGPAS